MAALKETSKHSENHAFLSFEIVYVIVTTIAFFSFLFVSFSITHLKIEKKNVPWACNNAKALYFKEALKVLIAIEDIFIDRVMENRLGYFAYYLFIFTFISYINILSVEYYDCLVNKIDKFLRKITLTIAFLCMLRVAFDFQLIEIAVYTPALVFAIFYVAHSFQSY